MHRGDATLQFKLIWDEQQISVPRTMPCGKPPLAYSDQKSLHNQTVFYYGSKRLKIKSLTPCMCLTQ